jgi:hypothetical protein
MLLSQSGQLGRVVFWGVRTSSTCHRLADTSIPFGGHADFFSAPGLTAYSLVKP